MNPNTSSIQGEKCYRNIADLPPEVEGILIATNKSRTESIVRETLHRGINNIWIQQRSDTSGSIKLLQEARVNFVCKHCILMFAEPVNGFHKFHRFVKGLFGGMPK